MPTLSACLFTLDDVRAAELAPFDEVYLGNPYCRQFKGNLTEHLDDLARAIELLKNINKKAYVTTFAVPRNRDLEAMERLFEKAAQEGADGLEVHNPGLMRLAHETHPDLPLHMGALGNVYTDTTAALLKGYGVRRIMASHELSLAELQIVRERAGCDVELLVHGRMLLGISEECLLVRNAGKQEGDCSRLCREEPLLTSGPLALATLGTATLSGRDVCMREHLGALAAGGFAHFRVQHFCRGLDFLAEVGVVYRQALEGLTAGEAPPADDHMRRLAALSPEGLCNGYYFRRAGCEYVPAP